MNWMRSNDGGRDWERKPEPNRLSVLHLRNAVDTMVVRVGKLNLKEGE